MKRALNIAEIIYELDPVHIAEAIMDLVNITSMRYTFGSSEEEAFLKRALTIRKTV